ncbi:hypothetical protein [Lutimonas zeaxanthinifaciens]|uniref:hypothetical protein n=1 Tax=Lutimonas zeaxanthinifaciens TaxID=3060215 RepID=UPI00265D3F7B|nr:hypothetical protein [Lutimonas sp. YSD2104]WKK66285.1 hypothetical protein QZH61_01380 [Lutimonas sp. YSD2104]
MEKVLQEEINPAPRVSNFARRSYQIYLEHFKSRNLNPTLTQEEFLKNYRS